MDTNFDFITWWCFCGSFSVGGEGGRDWALATLMATATACRWMTNQVTSNITMLDESDDKSVWAGGWNFKKED